MSGEQQYRLTERDWDLGFLVWYPELYDVIEIPKYFFSESAEQREVWAAIEELRAAGGPAKLVDIAGKCQRDGILSYLGAITTILGPIKPIDFRRRILRRKAEDLRKRQRSLSAPDKPNWAEVDTVAEEARQLELEAEQDALGTGLPPGVLITGAELQALDLRVEYVVDKLAPCRSIILIHGPGGLAKTWLALCIAKAVSEGKSLLGLNCQHLPVHYIDYENPLPMLADRVRKLDIRDVRFWHLSADPRPPKLDSDDWALFKGLPPGLIIFDTARSSFDGDENSSQDVGIVMGRLKELREQNNTIIVLHHTPKSNERKSKGATTWEDLADHVLAFYKTNRETLEETDEEIVFDPAALLSLGTGRKTRYEPFRIYITLDPDNGGFRLERGPNAAAVDLIAEYIAGEGRAQNQTQIIKWAHDNQVGPKNKQAFVRLLNQGEREKHWLTYDGLKNAKFYVPPFEAHE